MSTKVIQKSITLQKLTYILKCQPYRSLTISPNKSLLYIFGLANILILQLFFKMGQTKKLRQLLGHTGYIYCSVFMKKSNYFFTASSDKYILFWVFCQQLGWKIEQQLQGHEMGVFCLILNNGENKLISGSIDKTIRFWNKAVNWECKQTIITKIQILSMSLNQSETKLIACGSQSTVIVLESKKSEQIWSVIQEIQVNQGKNLCFLNDKMFIFQPNKSNLITIYKQNEQNLQFKQHKHQQLFGSQKSLWQCPIKYIQKQNLLLIKIGMVVNLIKYTESEEFKILEQIQYQTEGVFGTISEDARYLITWQEDEIVEGIFKPRQVQIRILKQFN